VSLKLQSIYARFTTNQAQVLSFCKMQIPYSTGYLHNINFGLTIDIDASRQSMDAD